MEFVVYILKLCGIYWRFAKEIRRT